jgi:hypothetical protein
MGNYKLCVILLWLMTSDVNCFNFLVVEHHLISFHLLYVANDVVFDWQLIGFFLGFICDSLFEKFETVFHCIFSSGA